MNPHAQSAVTEALHHAVATLGETGLQVAAIHRGEVVVDTFAGIADPATGRPVDGNTLFTVWSMSKGVTATVVHRLVERGILAYDEPLARWWPAFGAHGKGGITVRHALSHRAGLKDFKGLPSEAMPSLAATGRNIEEAVPDWAPGASMGYHGLTFGTLLGRVVEEATGHAFADVVRAEVTGQLGMHDLYCGVPNDPSVTDRIATLHVAGDPAPSLGHAGITADERAFLQGVATGFNHPAMRAGCIPAGGMIASARAFVRHYGAMREAGLDGVRLLDPDTIAGATVPYFGADGATVEWIGRMGLGYIIGGSPHLHCGVVIPSPWPDSFGHTGLGGSLSMYCPSRDLAVTLTKNALMPGRLECHTWDLVMRALCNALGIPYEA